MYYSQRSICLILFYTLHLFITIFILTSPLLLPSQSLFILAILYINL